MEQGNRGTGEPELGTHHEEFGARNVPAAPKGFHGSSVPHERFSIPVLGSPVPLFHSRFPALPPENAERPFRAVLPYLVALVSLALLTSSAASRAACHPRAAPHPHHHRPGPV